MAKSKWTFSPRPIADARRKHKLTYRGFGRELAPPMASGQVKDIESGELGLTVATLVKICNAYDINPAEFFRGGRENGK